MFLCALLPDPFLFGSQPFLHLLPCRFPAVQPSCATSEGHLISELQPRSLYPAAPPTPSLALPTQAPESPPHEEDCSDRKQEHSGLNINNKLFQMFFSLI